MPTKRRQARQTIVVPMTRKLSSLVPWWERPEVICVTGFVLLLMGLVAILANQQSNHDEQIREIRATTQRTDRAGNWPTR